MASFSTRREDHFQKKVCPKWSFPSEFVKSGSEILNLFLAEKNRNGRLFCFVCFVLLQLRPILAYSIILLFDVWLGNCSTPKVLIF